MGRLSRTLALIISILVVAGAAAATASAKMRVNRISPTVCKTTGGGRFVEIKQFPGEKIDRRLRRDVRYLVKKYNVLITDGFSRDGVHSLNGEHPLGLAADIVPNLANGGRWRDINRLAKWAEPSQDQPRSPFRWVGYNGDVNHGRGHHLHLSWGHSAQKPFRPARTVYSIKCPRPPKASKPSPPAEPAPEPTPPAGGGISIPGSGGIGADQLSYGLLAPVVTESAGVDLGG